MAAARTGGVNSFPGSKNCIEIIFIFFIKIGDNFIILCYEYLWFNLFNLEVEV